MLTVTTDIMSTAKPTDKMMPLKINGMSKHNTNIIIDTISKFAQMSGVRKNMFWGWSLKHYLVVLAKLSELDLQ